jgi:DNA-damage-inducible protein J
MTNNQTMTVRLSPDLKEQFTNTCHDMGISVSAMVGLFAKAVVRERKIPFEIKADESINGLTVSEHERRLSVIKSGNAVSFRDTEWEGRDSLE